MYNLDYQEDINVNAFFKILKRSKLYTNVERNCWLVCVPQTSSLAGLKITQDILDVHVLQPSPYFQGEYITANNKTVTIEDGVISITTDLREHRTAKILFEETFYTKESKSFRVLCIDTPLAGEVKLNPASAVQMPPTKSLAGITSFLHSYAINSIVLAKVHEQIEELGRTYVLVKGFEDHAVGKAKSLSEKALEDLVCANPDFRYLYDDDHLNNELSLVVESYVVGALYPFLFSSLKSCFAVEDARIRDNIHEWRSKDIGKELGLKADLMPHIAHITPHLQRMESCHTPLEKLWCVQEGLDAASFAVSISQKENNTLGADDTLPLLIAALIESAPPNLHTTLFYVQNFIFAKIATSSLGYQLVNLQAAIQFIKGQDSSNDSGLDDSSSSSSFSNLSPTQWMPVHSLAENYKNTSNNRYSTSVITDYRKNAQTLIQSDEILAYLTKGVQETNNFSPNRYTPSVRSASSTNLSIFTKEDENNKNNNNNNNYNNTNMSRSKSVSSNGNPLTDHNYQDWLGGAAPAKRSTSPPLGSRTLDRNSAPFKSSPTLLHTPTAPISPLSSNSPLSPNYSSNSPFNSYSSSSSSSSSLSSNSNNRRTNFLHQQTFPAPQPYKKAPSVIKLDTNLSKDDGEGGGFLAQLRKLGDDGVSSSQFKR